MCGGKFVKVISLKSQSPSTNNRKKRNRAKNKSQYLPKKEVSKIERSISIISDFTNKEEGKTSNPISDIKVTKKSATILCRDQRKVLSKKENKNQYEIRKKLSVKKDDAKSITSIKLKRT